MPETAKEKSISGARAFTEHYYKLVEYGHATGKWGPVKNLSKNCQMCELFWTKDQQLFDNDEDVVTKVGTPDDLGIQEGKIRVDAEIEVGVNLKEARSRVERIERVQKRWHDDATISYDQRWKVVSIEPDQLDPSDNCIAGRCLDFQKERANGGDDG